MSLEKQAELFWLKWGKSCPCPEPPNSTEPHEGSMELFVGQRWKTLDLDQGLNLEVF